MGTCIYLKLRRLRHSGKFSPQPYHVMSCHVNVIVFPSHKRTHMHARASTECEEEGEDVLTPSLMRLGDNMLIRVL